MVTSAELRAPRFAELLGLYLRSRGVQNAHTRPLRKLSELVLDEDASLADVQGIPRFHVVARASNSLSHLSETLDAATDRADREGRGWPLVFWYRKGRGAADAYVVTSAATMAEIMVELQERQVA